MAGQGSKSDAFPGKFYLGYGPNGINLLCNQNVDSDDSPSKEMHPELILNNASSGNYGTSANSSVPPRNIDLNAAYEDNGISTDSQELGVGGESNTNKNSSNSNTIVISSGIAGYVLEENEGTGGEDSTLGGRRLSCKRRAPEDASRQLFLGESSRSVKQGENPQEIYSGQPGGRITVHLGHRPSGAAGNGFVTEAGTSSETYQNSEQAENSQRNIRLRRCASQSNSVTDNDLSAWTIRNPHVQSLAGRQPVFYQFTHLTGSNTATPPGMVNVTSPMRPSMHTPNPSHTIHPVQWNRVTRARTSGSSTHALLHQDQNSRNDSRNGMFLPEFQRAHVPHMPASLRSANGRNFPGSISQSGSSTSHPPSWFPLGNMEEQYPGRMTELVNRSTEPQGQLCYCPFHLRESGQLPEGSGNISSSQIPLMPGLEIMGQRQAVTREMAMLALTAVQRRNRLAIQVRNALALVRRRGSLQFGNVMLIDGQALFGDSDDEDDELEDMRLDVDNMSYEQLLALEEQMGNVSTGLNKDVIVANLKRWKHHQVIEDGSDNEDEPCCICQEEYADEDELGKMRCGHDFHFNCIQRWLIEKNNCPICKKTAADV